MIGDRLDRDATPATVHDAPAVAAHYEQPQDLHQPSSMSTTSYSKRAANKDESSSSEQNHSLMTRT